MGTEDQEAVAVVTVSLLALPPLCKAAISRRMALFSPSPALMSPSTVMSPSTHSARAFRLVDARGEPHPILDDLYDSLDAAWSEAVSWWERQDHPSREPVGIGVEVSTTNGDWRTIRYPCS